MPPNAIANASRAVSEVCLSCQTDSKIANVSLYTGLAEVTRVFEPKLKKGDNKVIVSGLPDVLVPDSLRVEGRGQCTIYEVSLSDIPSSGPMTTSDRLEDLIKQKIRLEKALMRCHKAIAAVQSFQNSIAVRHVKADELANLQRGIDAAAEEWDLKQLDLEEQITEVTRDIEQEQVALGEVKVDNKLRKRVYITLVADKECDVEIVLKYAVSSATWDPTYAIYVKMDTKEKAVKLIYKAAISQNTGESWNDIPLTLETVTPTTGLNIPELQPWTLSMYKPMYGKYLRKSAAASSLNTFGGHSMRKESAASSDSESDGGPPRGGGRLHSSRPPNIKARGLTVTSKGDINATFSVPGLMTIPSDGASHTVTIMEVYLDAAMSWVTVPKKSPKAHLTAKIKNDSEYTLLRGIASIYVNGSFISRSDIPTVSPQESFDCPLGIDPAVRITYHPRSKKVTQPSFTRRNSTYLFSQRISISNTKATPISYLKVREQVPVSEDSNITVNLTSPGLVLPQANKKGVIIVPEPVKISSQVVARWEGADEPEMDPGQVGKDGKRRP
ncbi:Protein F37C4.5 [Psilocybe cubensis]|uniref:Protein F37C4.5 n=1 Tax=Psilocybe cubensis TaxID=181762 RepID=A0ACB8GWA3_PSICU|nr:Protein F37C4.5 [Psilocybe cubensis]KAH9479803.1 Protein F37C4.5 [Psilocybe cubensis]